MSLPSTMLDESLLVLQETRATWNVQLERAPITGWMSPGCTRRCCPAADATRWPVLD